MARHLKSHTEEKRFKCTYCGRKFRQKTNQVNHEQKSCSKKLFNELTHANQHKKTAVIPEEEKVPCLQCGKLVTEINMVRHMKIHTGDKPFECILCGKKFHQKTNAERHQLTHQENQMNSKKIPEENCQN